MASSFTNNIRLEEMVQGEQDNTWGDKTRDNHLKLLRALAGRVSIALAAADVTLDIANGGDGVNTSPDDDASAMILDCSGVLTANVNLIAPAETKVYIIKNATTGSFTVGVKTLSGAVLDVPQGETILAWCDGLDFFTINSLVSGTIAQATNALQLGGIVAANYAQLAVKNTWTNPQIVEGQDITLTAGTYTPNADTDTTMYLAQAEVTENVTIANPTGTPVKGQIMTFHVEQHGVTIRTLTWGSKFIFADDVNVELTQTIDKVDIFTAQYNANLDRWIVAGVAQNLPRA